MNTLLTFLLTSLLTFACYPIFKSAIKAFKLKVKYRSMNESPNPRSAYLDIAVITYLRHKSIDIVYTFPRHVQIGHSCDF